MAITTAKGTQLLVGSTTSPHNYASIAQCRSFTGPTVKPDIVDVTTHDTPGFWRRMLAVLISPGTVSFDMNFDSDEVTHAFTTGLWSYMTALAKQQFEMIFPNSAGQLDFDGYIGQHEFGAPVDNVLIAKLQIAITDSIVPV